MYQPAKLMCFAILLGLTGCIALNQDWTQKPATKTDYLPGQQYQLLTNVFFSMGREPFVLFRKILGDSDSMFDAGTRLRVTTVHYGGDSFEMGFFTAVRAEVVTGPFKEGILTYRFYLMVHMPSLPATQQFWSQSMRRLQIGTQIILPGPLGK
jgi:hypothetical protein